MTLHVGDAADAAVEEVEELFEAASFTDVLWGVVSVLVLAFFFALILHSVWKSAQDHPAAVEKRPNGVRGGLLLVAAYLLALGLFRLASAANIVAYLNAVGGEAATLVMNMKFAGPAALAALISFIGCHRLACGRRPLAAAAAIAAMWLSSVVYAWVEPVLIGGDGPTPGELASLAILSGAATLYLLIAPRARHTYGLWGL